MANHLIPREELGHLTRWSNRVTGWPSRWPTNNTLHIYILRAYWCADGQMAKKSAHPASAADIGRMQLFAGLDLMRMDSERLPRMDLNLRLKLRDLSVRRHRGMRSWHAVERRRMTTMRSTC
jgi:hypothetical protein